MFLWERGKVSWTTERGSERDAVSPEAGQQGTIKKPTLSPDGTDKRRRALAGDSEGGGAERGLVPRELSYTLPVG